MYFLKTNLRKFLFGIALLILPIFFNDNFNGGWIPIITYILLIISGISMLLQTFAKVLKINILYLFTLLLIIEVGIYSTFFLVKFNQVKSPFLLKFSQDIYFQYLRNIPSFQMGLGKYDPDLFYTLKPSNSNSHSVRPSYAVNSNIEFSNTYKINSQGIRDDEISLDFPEIIILGDSHTMGWGVEEDETFSNLLEQKMEKKILNTGIVSYGTARQYLMFNKLKIDSCKTIILQYCSNDMRENQSFVENGYQLKISSEEEYQFRYKRNFLHANYYPFKFSFESFAHQIRRLEKPKEYEPVELLDQVSNFFAIVKLLKEVFDGEIIIFNLESYDTTDKYFLAFKKYMEEHHLEKIQLIDFSKKLKENDYFIIDGHINVSGHQKVSDEIGKILK